MSTTTEINGRDLQAGPVTTDSIDEEYAEVQEWLDGGRAHAAALRRYKARCEAVELLPEGMTMERTIPDNAKGIVGYRARDGHTIVASAGAERATRRMSGDVLEPCVRIYSTAINAGKSGRHAVAQAAVLAMAATHDPEWEGR